MGHFLEFLSLGLVSVFLLWKGVQCDPALYTISVPATVSVQEGLCVIIPCNFTYDPNDARGNSPFYGYWYEDGKDTKYGHPVATNDPGKTIEEYARNRFRLSEEVERENCSLTILDAQKMDKKQYFFRMDKAKAKFNFSLPGVHIKPRVEVTDPENPKIQMPGKLKAGHEVNLTCTAPESCSLKPPHVSWEGLPCQVKTGSNATQVNDLKDHISVLTCTPLASDNGQELICQVTYGEGPDPLRREERVRLNVTFPPQKLRTIAEVIRANGSFQNYTGASAIPIEKGDAVVLRCEAEGNPWPNVAWTKTSQSSEAVRLMAGSELRLGNVTMADVGEYRCRVENTEGFDNASFRLSNAENDASSETIISGVIIGLIVAGVFVLIVASVLVFRKCRREGKAVVDEESYTKQKTIHSEGLPATKDLNSVGPNPEEDENVYETEEKMEDTYDEVNCNPEELYYATVTFNPQQPSTELASRESPTEYAEIKKSQPSDFSGDQEDIKGFAVI